MGTARNDRRLGQRHPTPGLTVQWRVPRKRRFRSREVSEQVVMVNVSATGAAVVATTVPDLDRHSVVTLDCGGPSFDATVRRIVAGKEPDVSYYGLQFINPSADVIDLLLSHAGVAPRDVLEDYWRRAG